MQTRVRWCRRNCVSCTYTLMQDLEYMQLPDQTALEVCVPSIRGLHSDRRSGVQKEVAVKIMKIKPGAKQESLTELPYTEAAIAGICIHANIVQTMYSDLLPVFDKDEQGSFWSKAKDERSVRKDAERGRGAAAKGGGDGVKEWQVRMVMEICDLGARLLLGPLLTLCGGSCRRLDSVLGMVVQFARLLDYASSAAGRLCKGCTRHAIRMR